MLLTLAWNQYVLGALMVLFLIICALVILTILVQRPQGGGLAGAFGGGSGSGQTAFGTKTGDALTVATIIVFTLYLVLAVVLNAGTAVDRSVRTPEAAPAQPSPAPATAPLGTAPPASANDAGAGSTPAPATPVPAPGATPPASGEPGASVPSTTPAEPKQP